MNGLELLKILNDDAKKHRLDVKDSVIRNHHMNKIEISDIEYIPQNVIDAILVDFINTIGMKRGIDYALYTTDLVKE